MNAKSTPTRASKSRAQLLLEITAISGEYPADNICRIFASASYAKKTISALCADKLIKPVNKGGVKGYRLAIGGKRKLITDNPARFAGCLDGDVETNKMRADHARRLRLHSMAQVHTLMHNAGVQIFADNKPKLFSGLISPLLQPAVNTAPNRKTPDNKAPDIPGPCFYSSREQKVDADKSNAIRGSRATGALLTPTRVYAVYNTGGTHIKWREKVEQRYKAQIKDFILRAVLPEQYKGKEINGIMIGQDLKALEQYWAKDMKGGSQLSFLENTYQPFYYITNDIFGEIQLKLLCDDTKMTALKNTLSKELQPPDAKYPIEHDALNMDGNPVLFCCLPDIPRLLRFNRGLALRGITGKVIAFDFQQDVLMRYLGDKAEFTKISFEKFRLRFFPDD